MLNASLLMVKKKISVTIVTGQFFVFLMVFEIFLLRLQNLSSITPIIHRTISIYYLYLMLNVKKNSKLFMFAHGLHY